MANSPKLAADSADAMVDALAALANSGKLRLYTTPQPATADDAIGSVTLLAELTMGATAFGASVNGVAAANAITQDSSADNNGTAVWFRLLKSDGTTKIMDGSVGKTSGYDLNLSENVIVAGGTVQVTSFQITLPLS